MYRVYTSMADEIETSCFRQKGATKLEYRVRGNKITTSQLTIHRVAFFLPCLLPFPSAVRAPNAGASAGRDLRVAPPLLWPPRSHPAPHQGASRRALGSGGRAGSCGLVDGEEWPRGTVRASVCGSVVCQCVGVCVVRHVILLQQG